MQISASNLIIAAQQVRSPAPPRTEPQSVANATVSPGGSEQFETLAFKTATPANKTPLARAENPFAPAKRLGSQLDITI
jgi:hypothetical protein